MYKVTSCLLFHGPSAELAALDRAKAFGRLVPFDSSSLKKDGARSVVEMLSGLPVGSGTRSLLIGPLDEVAAATSDVLLKTIEEFDPEGIRPFLWAWDLGGVSKTIRSRCVCLFAGGVDVRLVEYAPAATQIVKAYLAKDWVTLVEAWKESKGDEAVTLRAVADVLAVRLSAPDVDPRLSALWDNLRPLFGPMTLTPARILAAFLEGGL